MTYRTGLSILSLALTAGLASGALADDHGHKHHRPDFATYDANGDGQITKDEMQAAHEKMRQEHFAKADANGDGAVTLEELKAHMSKRMADKAERRMKRMDANGDGKITQDEAKARHGKKHDKMFSHMDENGDGMLSKEEFEKMKEHHKGKKKEKAE